MSNTVDLLRCIAIETAHGTNRKLWTADEVSDEDVAAAELAGVTRDQFKTAAEGRQPYVPKTTINAKRYRDMDDDEFDRTWDEERGNQAGIPL